MNSFNDDHLNKIYWAKESEYDKEDRRYPTNKLDFKWWYIAWKIVTDKKFRWLLKSTILYAIRWENFIRGSDSSEVFLFQSYYIENILTIKK